MTEPNGDAIADKAMHQIWKEWFEFYERHFCGANIRISMADQIAFYEIAQPILRLLSSAPATRDAFYSILKNYIPGEVIDQAWQELREAGLVP